MHYWKKYLLVGLGLVLAASIVSPLRGDPPALTALKEEWSERHNLLAREIALGWLWNEPAEVLNGRLNELVNLRLRLASVGYGSTFLEEDVWSGDPAETIEAITYAVLAREGFDPDTSVFFLDRVFLYRVKEDPGAETTEGGKPGE